MFRLLFVLFILIPILEIYLLIQVGGVIGALPTVLIVIATAAIGAFLLRLQSIATLQRVQTTLSQGEMPAIELMEAVILLVCGALLLTPGFFTDALGFLGLLPYTRRLFIFWLIKRIKIKGMGMHASDPRTPSNPSHPKTIEGEYRRED